jgi:hypothetical protein
MAKMFYTLEEVCLKLGKTEDEITDMVRSGQIQEFRDRDKLMFKVEQIDLLAGGEEDTSEVTLELEDTSGGSGVALRDESGGEIALSDSREDTGISVFDTDHGVTETEAVTDESGVDEGLEEEELAIDAVGSGSGLLDLTRESDETSLGAELLEEAYTAEQDVEIPAHASGLFEAAGAERGPEEIAEEAPGVAAGVPMVVEVYDGTGSGLGAGMLIGALVALVCVAVVAIVGVSGATPDLATRFAQSSGSLWTWTLVFLGVTIVLGAVGLLLGKASE